MPQYYGREPFDGVVTGGDPELVLADAIRRLAADELPEHGMLVRSADGWTVTGPGRWLDPADWPFPDPSVIAFEDYRLARELRGKPTDDLSFDVCRGCHVGCTWCVDPLKGGRRDRRRPVRADRRLHGAGPRPLRAVPASRTDLLAGPVRGSTTSWRSCRSRGLSIPFKAVTLVDHLADERLVASLASVGMRGIGFGIETLTVDRSRRPLTPKVHERLLERGCPEPPQSSGSRGRRTPRSG